MYRKFRACLRPAGGAARLMRPPAWAGHLVRAGLAGLLAVTVGRWPRWGRPRPRWRSATGWR